MLNIKDKPGCISKTTMRQYFEGAIKQTPAFASNTPLEAMVINGEFSHYLNADTDTMWLGFALGMRCAERVERAKTSEPSTAPAAPQNAQRQALQALEHARDHIGPAEPKPAALCDVEAAIDALSRALGHPAATAPAAPQMQALDSYALVPLKPTQAMCQAMQEKLKEWPRFPFRVSPVYQAALAAAPTPGGAA